VAGGSAEYGSYDRHDDVPLARCIHTSGLARTLFVALVRIAHRARETLSYDVAVGRAACTTAAACVLTSAFVSAESLSLALLTSSRRLTACRDGRSESEAVRPTLANIPDSADSVVRLGNPLRLRLAEAASSAARAISERC
jgi:hypothetical protein